MSTPSPPMRLRSGAVRAPTTEQKHVDSIVEAVMMKLHAAGIGAGALVDDIQPLPEEPAMAAPTEPAIAAPTEPSRMQRQLWTAELRSRMPDMGVREREEVRSLLIIGEGAGPPPADHVWFWGRVRLMLIVAHHGWGAALADSRVTDMERLGIRLHPAAGSPPPAPPAVAAVAAGGRGRPCRPSGLRRPAPPAGAGRGCVPRPRQ